MFRTTPKLTPDQYRWLKELRTQRVAARCLPAAVREQLLSLNYITAPDDGLARMTGQGHQAIGTHVA